MRQINFVVIFVIALALVIFGIENTEPVIIHIAKGLDVEAPLCVELIIAMGLEPSLPGYSVSGLRYRVTSALASR
jgi:uncharacterized integral membrane protein